MFATNIVLTIMIRHRYDMLIMTIHHVLDITTSLGVCFPVLLFEIDRDRARMNVNPIQFNLFNSNHFMVHGVLYAMYKYIQYTWYA